MGLPARGLPIRFELQATIIWNTKHISSARSAAPSPSDSAPYLAGGMLPARPLARLPARPLARLGDLLADCLPAWLDGWCVLVIKTHAMLVSNTAINLMYITLMIIQQ